MIIAVYKPPQSIKAIHSRREDEHSNESGWTVYPRLAPEGMEGMKTESEIKKWQSLTLACRDVTVSPVDPVLMICNVAPRLNIPIRIPAENYNNHLPALDNFKQETNSGKNS